MEEYLDLNNNVCLDELKQKIKDCLKKVLFKPGFQYDLDIRCHNNCIIGCLEIDDKRNKIFKIEMQENEIKYFYVIDSLQSQGIGTEILKFVINLYKESEFEYIFAILGGCYLFSDWLSEYINNEDDSNDEDEMLKREDFYRRVGFKKHCKNDQIYMYFCFEK